MSSLDGKRYLTLDGIFRDLGWAKDMRDVQVILRNAYRMQWFRELVLEAGEPEAPEPEDGPLRHRIDTLENRLSELENRLQNTLEVNHLWDGS
ncbi:hypothetical protein AB0G06_43465 [Nonomuraea dietziae]|uniref:hypothetical protein n=1 Tax=Nonomuraea dietziae TaxID=65515 RepID=UPI0033FBE815